jgi:hypothetical protein
MERGLDGRLTSPLCKRKGIVDKIQGKMYSVQKITMGWSYIPNG